MNILYLDGMFREYASSTPDYPLVEKVGKRIALLSIKLLIKLLYLTLT